VKNLNDKIALYQERITQLEKENEVLQGKNATLTHERDSTSAQNTVLKREASVLHAGNIRLEPIHLKRSGKEVHTSKARKVDVLRITFDILENRIAESGNKAIYVRIIAPGGSTLSNAANASGNLTSAQGSAIPYSVMKDVALTKGTPINNITLDWKQDGDYEKGNYTIEIYNEGYKVGTGSVNMR
ncbi:MAG: hypothetical protein EBX41_05135, partial [Chitinophagia bacterium]|nr:hypothetical protein [Chitinophagia bacterium]